MTTKIIFARTNPDEENPRPVDVAMVEWGPSSNGSPPKVTIIRGREEDLQHLFKVPGPKGEVVTPSDKQEYIEAVRERFTRGASTYLSAQILENE